MPHSTTDFLTDLADFAGLRRTVMQTGTAITFWRELLQEHNVKARLTIITENCRSIRMHTAKGFAIRTAGIPLAPRPDRTAYDTAGRAR